MAITTAVNKQTKTIAIATMTETSITKHMITYLTITIKRATTFTLFVLFV